MEIWSTSCRPRDLRNGLGPVVPVVPCRALSARNWWRGNDFDLPCLAGDDLLRIDGKLTDGGSRTLAAFACGRLGPGRFPGTQLRIAGSGLPASTLVEVLILMILSGVVFLSVMDGFGLLNRFLDRTSQRISEQTEQYAGYFRTVDLAGDSDSLISEGERTLALYRKGGIHARLSLADSALIVRQDERSDTLLRNVVRLRTVPEPVLGARIDTMIVELRTEQDSVLSIGFVSRRPPDPLLEKLSGLEAKYRYEENENESNEESK